MGRKVISCLLVANLLLLLSTAYVTNHYTLNTNSTNFNFQKPMLDFTTMFSISDNGSQIPALVRSMNNGSTISNESIDFIVNTYGYHVHSIFLNFSEIKAVPIVEIMAKGTPSTFLSADNYINASFTLPYENSYGLLKNVSVYIYANNLANGFSWLIMNATSDGKPDKSTGISGTEYPASGYTGWYTITVNNYLNASKTYNRMFYLCIKRVGTSGTLRWYYESDTTTNDDQDVYYAGTYYTYDMFMNVTLLPPASNPSPFQVKMQVNGTDVTDTSYGGRWTYDTPISVSSIYFDITANWTILYLVKWELLSIEQIYANTSYIVSDSTVSWNVSISTHLPSTFIKSNITFNKPTDWINPIVLNNTDTYTDFTATQRSVKIYWQTGNGNWTVMFQGKNYLDSVEISPSHTVRIIDIVNTTIFFRSDVDPNNVTGDLKIYDFNNITLEAMLSSWVLQDNKLEFIWKPYDDIDLSGRYYLFAYWENGTEVGYIESYIDIVYNTKLTSQYDETQIRYLNENISIVVHYKDEFNDENITDAIVYGKWDFGAHVQFKDIGNGYYEAILSTANATPGNFIFQIFASKAWYESQSINITIKLVYNTSIIGRTVYHTNYSIPVGISVKYQHSNGTGIPNADVKIYINGSEKNMVDVGNGNYTYTLSATDVGKFNCTVIATKQGYVSQRLVIWVYVHELSTRLLLNTTTKAEEGSKVILNATLIYANGTPIVGALITFKVNVTFENGTSVLYTIEKQTDENGSAIVLFEVPENSEKVTVTAVYRGETITSSASISKEIQITPRQTFGDVITPYSDYLFFIVIAITIASIGLVVKRRKRAKKLTKIMVAQSFYDDLLNIKHLFVIHADSGMTLYYKPYDVEPLEPELISGFLTAMSQFATEVSSYGEETTEYKYKGMFIFVVRSGGIRVAFMSSQELSDPFKNIAKEVINEISEQYKEIIERWSGNVMEGKKVGYELEKRLALSLFYEPMSISRCKEIKDRALLHICNQIAYLQRTTRQITIKSIIDYLGKENIDLVLVLLEMGYLKEKQEDEKSKDVTPEKKSDDNENVN